ncbi:neprosin family prolyl endopeptidase [Actinoplanes sp. CA-142083]|uniref:neprosin family prolyl endopeptidase n=1 Tax=Actinoplanes sp. CA-142083 TaxID=3239903 RepID=UPI003D9374E7
MLKSRRGLLAAGLALAVVGALGVASTLNAGAEQISGASDQQPAAAPAAEVGLATPPALLPWGQRPEKIRKGRAGASSKSLRADGFDAAANDTSGSTQPRGRYAPKGRWAKNTGLRQERTNIRPPEPPPASPEPSDEPATEATEAPAPEETTAAPEETTAPEATEESTEAPATEESTPKATDNTKSAAPEPSGAGRPSPTAYYLYNVGSQEAETDGFYANMSIAKPELARSDYHTLGELALQSADGDQIVEIGWNVDRVVNGDDDPHLFVYHWVNDEESCYNGCGFQQYSKTIKPGDTLPADTVKKFAIQNFNGSWWVAYDSEWIGYFPESLWNEEGVKFSRSGLVQVFGEVAAATENPCTDMGNGKPAAVGVNEKSISAFMTTITYINGPEVAMWMRSSTKAYPVTVVNSRTFRYGGPGSGDCKDNQPS